MAAHRNPRKLIGLATVLCLMVAVAIGGYALANSQTPATNLAAQGGTSAPAADPTTPAETPSQAPTGGAAFVASCPDHGLTSAPGCGSWDAGPSSGLALGFAAGQQSSPNLLGVNQDPWSGGQGPQVLSASSFQDWSVTATDTDPSNAPGEVLTYPDASFNYYQLNTAGLWLHCSAGAVRPEQHHVADQRLHRVHAAEQRPRRRGRIRHVAEQLADRDHGVGGHLARQGP